eukprot:g15003.t1
MSTSPVISSGGPALPGSPQKQVISSLAPTQSTTTPTTATTTPVSSRLSGGTTGDRHDPGGAATPAPKKSTRFSIERPGTGQVSLVGPGESSSPEQNPAASNGGGRKKNRVTTPAGTPSGSPLRPPSLIERKMREVELDDGGAAAAAAQHLGSQLAGALGSLVVPASLGGSHPNSNRQPSSGMTKHKESAGSNNSGSAENSNSGPPTSVEGPHQTPNKKQRSQTYDVALLYQELGILDTDQLLIRDLGESFGKVDPDDPLTIPPEFDPRTGKKLNAKDRFRFMFRSLVQQSQKKMRKELFRLDLCLHHIDEMDAEGWKAFLLKHRNGHGGAQAAGQQMDDLSVSSQQGRYSVSSQGPPRMGFGLGSSSAGGPAQGPPAGFVPGAGGLQPYRSLILEGALQGEQQMQPMKKGRKGANGNATGSTRQPQLYPQQAGPGGAAGGQHTSASSPMLLSSSTPMSNMSQQAYFFDHSTSSQPPVMPPELESEALAAQYGMPQHQFAMPGGSYPMYHPAMVPHAHAAAQHFAGSPRAGPAGGMVGVHPPPGGAYHAGYYPPGASPYLMQLPMTTGMTTGGNIDQGSDWSDAEAFLGPGAVVGGEAEAGEEDDISSLGRGGAESAGEQTPRQ